MVHRDAPERAHDHAGIGGFLGLLDQREPAAGLDLDQADGAVVEGSGQDDAHDPGSEHPGRAPEEGIDGRAVSLLPRTVGAADAAAGQYQVLVGAGHADTARQDDVAIDRLRDVQRGGPPEDVGKRTDALGREVVDDEHGAGKVGGQASHQPKKGLDAPSGKPHHCDVANWHASRAFLIVT